MIQVTPARRICVDADFFRVALAHAADSCFEILLFDFASHRFRNERGYIYEVKK